MGLTATERASRGDPRIPILRLLVVLTTGLGSVLACAESAVEQQTPRALLTSGPVSGALSPYSRDITVFRGIPFAQPPVAERRWRPPVAPVPWDEPRAVLQPGSPCWQPIVPETSIYSRGSITPSEDCLYLNVWAPSSEAPPRAVMVWFHGGGNTTGHGSSLIFDGTRLAQKGVVVVTANYRMGPFGFLAHEALTAESPQASSGNYALLDQLAVLEWVRDNIQAFGGDPERVVVFGQSAGSLDVCLLMASPLAKDLISGVIGFSGGCLKVDQTLMEAEAAGAQIAAQFPDPSLTALRRLPAAEFAKGAAAADVPLAQPIVDGWVIPEPPRRIYQAGRQNRVPLIVGDMADEFRGLGAGMPDLTAAQYAAEVRQNYPTIADQLLEAYAPVAARSPLEAARKMATHSTFTWQSRAWADLVSRSGTSAWVYHFTHPTAVFSLYIPERPEFPDPNGPRSLGAYHSGDLAYHFNNVGIVGLGWEDWDFRLADLISSYWVNFAETGDPNGAGLPGWPAYDRADDRVQEFGSLKIWTVVHPQHEVLNLFDRANSEP